MGVLGKKDMEIIADKVKRHGINVDDSIGIEGLYSLIRSTGIVEMYQIKATVKYLEAIELIKVNGERIRIIVPDKFREGLEHE